MSLFDECNSLIKGPHILHESNVDSISLITTVESTAVRNTAPSFVYKERINSLQRSVYYISDLHLVHHIIHHFKKAASEENIRAYIHNIVSKLFDGEFGNAITSFENPIVMFGGDVSSSFAVAEMFYRDFLSTWEQIVDDKYIYYSQELFPVSNEFNVISEELSKWKEKHPWINNARKPLEDYSDRKVPQRIKDLIVKIPELRQRVDDKRRELGLDCGWENNYKRTREHEYIYTIIGNHELWDFDSYDACENAYKDLFAKLSIVFLNNKICPLGLYRSPTTCNFDQNTGEWSIKLLRRDDNPKEFDNQLFYLENILIVGGLGFAALNSTFNADQGIYGASIDRSEEVRQCEEWQEVLKKAIEIAKKHHCALVILSHTPISDWMEKPENLSNCFVFSGHTHRNIAYGGENNTFVFADNQVGYSSEKLCFKKAILHAPRNPFAADPDGFREISCEEYKEYYRYVEEATPGTGTIERYIKLYESKLYVIKKDGYVGFFLVSQRGVYICNGGQIRKIGLSESLERYFENFTVVINRYIVALTPLRQIQEKLAAYIKSIGGSGRIHGTIVDIDFENHVMVNTSDGTLTYYNSPMFGLVKTYSDIGALLHAHCPALEAAYFTNSSQLVPIISETLAVKSSSYEHIDIKNSQYSLSHKINALQRLFDRHILRAWNSELEIRQLPL